MECKYEYIPAILAVLGGSNRNIVECKFIFKSICVNAQIVLIETLWNVNPEDLSYDSLAYMF